MPAVTVPISVPVSVSITTALSTVNTYVLDRNWVLDLVLDLDLELQWVIAYLGTSRTGTPSSMGLLSIVIFPRAVMTIVISSLAF